MSNNILSGCRGSRLYKCIARGTFVALGGRIGVVLLVLVVLAGLLPVLSWAASAPSDDAGVAGAAVSDVQLMGVRVPFVENLGQLDSQVLFYADTFYGKGFVTGDGITHEILGEDNKTLVVKEQFLDSQGNVIALCPKGEDMSSAKISYFVGSDPSCWKSGVRSWNVVDLGEVYPGISVKLKAHGANIEKLFYVSPGADVADIRIRVVGADTLNVDAAEQLVLGSASFGYVSMTAPVAYQDSESGREDVAVGYSVDGDTYGYRAGAYDPGRELVIDPVLAYSTYIGGTGFEAGRGIVADAAGNTYFVWSDYDSNGVSSAMSVNKLSQDGSSLVYSTYLGGNSLDEGLGIAVDSAGNAYVTGNTRSSDFPVTPGAFQTVFIDSAFVSKLSPDGSSLVYSTYLGSSVVDTGRSYGYGISVDGSGNAYVTGKTSSSTFPVTPGVFQTTFGGGSYDGFVSKVSPGGSSLVYSTYLGGAGSDVGYGIALDGSGNAYVTGYTASDGFPVTSGAFQTAYRGGNEAFVCKLGQDGSSLVYSTYLGGSGSDYGYGLAVDGSGNACVSGSTQSIDFPVTPGAFQSARASTTDAFVAKVSPDGSSLVYSTYLGGTGNDYSRAIAIDSHGNAYVTGYTISTNFPVTPGAYQTTRKGNNDVFLTMFGPGGSPIYSTYIGGTSADECYGIALDGSGNVYLTGLTRSTGFPVTPGAYDTTFGGGSGFYDAFVLKMSFGDILPPVADFAADVTSGCNPLIVQFTDLSIGNVITWAWDFENDGVVDSTSQNPSHTYVVAGTYTVNLTVTGPNGLDSEVKTGYIHVLQYLDVFPGKSLLPTDPDIDGLYEDVNGNGRIDFEDVVTYFQNMGWIRGNSAVGIAPFDYNGNGLIDFDDLVVLFNERMGG
jgi:PKD repeat protein